MKIKDGYVLKKVVDEYVLYPVGQNVVEARGLMKINMTAKFILEKMENEITYDDLLQSIVDEYEAESEEEVERVRKDLDRFLDSLRHRWLLSE